MTPVGALRAPRRLRPRLAIAKGVAEAHGAFITAENRDGAGARFTIEVPSAPA